jgi:hypothetical protein
MMLEAVCSKPSHNIRLENEYLWSLHLS